MLKSIRPAHDQPFEEADQPAEQGSNNMDDAVKLSQLKAELSYLNRHCELTGSAQGRDSRDFTPLAKERVTGFLQALQARHVDLAPLVQMIDIGQPSLDLGKIQDVVHAVRSLRNGLIGLLRGLVFGGA
jgi:hypothetical protein